MLASIGRAVSGPDVRTIAVKDSPLSSLGSEGPYDDGLTIETMRRRHIRGVRLIDREVYASPWSSMLYHDELRRRGDRIYRIGRLDGRIVAYAGVMIVAGEGHVTSIAVDPRLQGRQVGARLLLSVTAAAIDAGVEAMTLEVRVGNRRAQELYRRFGYAPAGVRPRYYPDNGEDALIMWCHDIGGSEVASRLALVAAATQGQGEGSVQ